MKRPPDKDEKKPGFLVEYRALIILLVIALVTRLFWLWWRPYPIVGDAVDYLTYARNIAFYHTFSLAIDNHTVFATTGRPPLYPLLIAALWWGDSAPIGLVRALQVILGSATAGLVYFLARDRFDRRVAAIAGLGIALAPMSSFFTGAILTETLFTFLLTLGFLLWGRRHYVLAGLILGLATLTTPRLLPFLLVLPFIGLLPPWRKQLRPFVTITVLALGAISPWVIRNAFQTGRFIPVISHGWADNMLYGAIETPNDPWTTLRNHPLVKIDEGNPDPFEVDKVRIPRALNYIKDHPWRWLVVRLTNQYPRLFLDDGGYVLDFYDVHFGDVLRNPRPFVILLVANKFLFVLGNILLFVFAGVGLVAERDRFVELSHLTLFPIILLLSYLPLWIETRFSLPIMPSVSIAAAIGLLTVWNAYKKSGAARFS